MQNKIQMNDTKMTFQKCDNPAIVNKMSCKTKTPCTPKRS